MAQMNRNVNLEEISSDATLGIPWLNYQTFGQKLVLIISITISIALYAVDMFVLRVNMVLTMLSFFIPLTVGILFGCNYNEDFSLFNYIKLIIFKPSIKLYSTPIEDIMTIRGNAELIEKAKESESLKSNEASPEMQKKSLLKLIIGVSVFIVFLVVIIICFVILKHNDNQIHHSVSMFMTRITI